MKTKNIKIRFNKPFTERQMTFYNSERRIVVVGDDELVLKKVNGIEEKPAIGDVPEKVSVYFNDCQFNFDRDSVEKISVEVVTVN